MQEDFNTTRQSSLQLSAVKEQDHSELSINSLADYLELHSLFISYPPIEPSPPKGREDPDSPSSKTTISSQSGDLRTPSPVRARLPKLGPEKSSPTMHPAYYTEWDHQHDTERLLSRSPSPPFLPTIGYRDYTGDVQEPSSCTRYGRHRCQSEGGPHTSFQNHETLYEADPGNLSNLSSIFPAPVAEYDNHGYDGLDYLEAVTNGPQCSDSDSYTDQAAVGDDGNNLLGLDYWPPGPPHQNPQTGHDDSQAPSSSFDLLSDDQDGHYGQPATSSFRQRHANVIERRAQASSIDHHDGSDHQHHPDAYEQDSVTSNASCTTPATLTSAIPAYIVTSPTLDRDRLHTPQSNSETGYPVKQHASTEITPPVLQPDQCCVSSKSEYGEDMTEVDTLESEDRVIKEGQYHLNLDPQRDQASPARKDTYTPQSDFHQRSLSPSGSPQPKKAFMRATVRKRAVSEESEEAMPVIKKPKPNRPPAPKIVLAKALPKPRLTSPRSSPSQPRNAPLGMRAAFKSAPTRTSAASSPSKPTEIITDQGPEAFFASAQASKAVNLKPKPFKTPFGTGSKGGGIKLKPKDPNTILERNNRAFGEHNPGLASWAGTSRTHSDSGTGMSVGAQLIQLEKEATIFRQAVKVLAKAEEDDELRELVSTWRIAGRNVVEQIFAELPEPAGEQDHAGLHRQAGSWMTSRGGDDRFDITPEQERWLATCPKNADGEPIDDDGNTVIPKPRDLRLVIQESCGIISQGGKGEYYPRRQYEEGIGSKSTNAPVGEREWNMGTMMMRMSVDPALLGWDDAAEDWFDIDTLDA